MSDLKKHNRLGDFVRLLWYHRADIEKQMPLPHNIRKYKDHIKRGLIISTPELCIIFARSANELAKKFCYSFHIDRATDEKFKEMLGLLREGGYHDVADELLKRRDRPFIDIQHSANLLRADSQRDESNPYIYVDYNRFRSFQFLCGTARGYRVDWKLVEEAVTILDGRQDPLQKVQEQLEKSGEFDPASDEDAREKTMRAIAVRRGQARFRSGLMEAYQGVCAVTGCNAPDALEAAHIVPYKGTQWNGVSNGLLLRADIHVLFDLGLLAIDPDSLTVQLSDQLKTSSYAELQGKRIAVPETAGIAPNKQALARHKAQSHTQQT